ncbi:DUF3667 domain-containing protein [Duganella sp. CF458]|uniref:DUF3667 domain-containing protein n=1 Tax=Duganella sp. CF458 TaxID=1884368 RepID=UPI00147D5F47|nr:DUF3667 domain-containing protein [Duganella sp. CF458]
MKNLFFHFGRQAESQRPAAAGSCHNCHAEVSTTYCGECGQKAKAHIASAHEFLHHFVGHYIAAEGKLWRTLGWLIAKPGQLTVEFIGGRRGHFVDPLRLLLTVSLLAFLVMKWEVYRLPVPPVEPVSARATVLATAATARQVHQADGWLFDIFARVSDKFVGNYGKYAAQPEPLQGAQFWEAWLRFGPTVVLCLIPLMAAVLKLLHLGSGWRYGEHLVFAMHFQTVTFLALLLTVGGMRGGVKPLLGSALGLYILLAMRKVYGGGWIVLLLRTVMFGYCLVASFEVLVRIAFLLRMA